MSGCIFTIVPWRSGPSTTPGRRPRLQVSSANKYKPCARAEQDGGGDVFCRNGVAWRLVGRWAWAIIKRESGW